MPLEDRVIVRISKGNRRKTAPEIAAELKRGHRKPTSVTTVKRRLSKAGLREYIAYKHTKIRPSKTGRKVLWTDESNFEVYGSHSVFVRRSAGEGVSD
ncbi:hypothetical protein Trydic_g19062 [Trypoxylus dichotomus]